MYNRTFLAPLDSPTIKTLTTSQRSRWVVDWSWVCSVDRTSTFVEKFSDENSMPTNCSLVVGQYVLVLPLAQSTELLRPSPPADFCIDRVGDVNDRAVPIFSCRCLSDTTGIYAMSNDDGLSS